MKIVYGIPHCYKCEELKKKYDESGIEYEYRDARNYLQKFRELGISEMPYEEEI